MLIETYNEAYDFSHQQKCFRTKYKDEVPDSKAGHSKEETIETK